MLTAIVSMFTGAGLNWLPDLFKGVSNYFQDKADKAHELALLEKVEKQRTQREQIAGDSSELVGGMQAVLDESASAREHDTRGSSAMVEMLEASEGCWLWARSFVLIGFATVEMLKQSVRPVLAYVAEGTWVFVKVANSLAMQVEQGITWQEAARLAWTAEDMAILGTIIGFYFGGRVKKYAEAKWQQVRARSYAG